MWVVISPEPISHNLQCLFYSIIIKIDSFHLCEEFNLVLLLTAEFYIVDSNRFSI
jgi:hypothetical protein